MNSITVEEFKFMFPASKPMKLARQRSQLAVGAIVAIHTFYNESMFEGSIRGKIAEVAERGICVNGCLIRWVDVCAPPVVKLGNGYAVEIVQEAPQAPATRLTAADRIAALAARVKAGFMI